jgi:hypothetical protein
MDQLAHECRSYAVYLIGQWPDSYTVEKYRDFHARPDVPGESDPFDRFLVEFSSRGPSCARLADCYACRFRKASVLRKKLVLMLAILECSPKTYEILDRVHPGGPVGAVMRLGWDVVVSMLYTVVAIPIFTAVRFGLLFARKSRETAMVQP